MAKRSIKADVALQEARGRVVEAKDRVDSLRNQLEVAVAVFETQKAAYVTLERALTREPRKPNPKSTSAPSAEKKSKKASTDSSVANTEAETVNATTAAVCAIPNCGQLEMSQIHFNDSHPKFHKFHAATKTKGAGA